MVLEYENSEKLIFEIMPWVKNFQGNFSQKKCVFAQEVFFFWTQTKDAHTRFFNRIRVLVDKKVSNVGKKLTFEISF